MEEKEIALELTKIINNNMNANSSNYLNEKGVINTYKRVLKELED